MVDATHAALPAAFAAWWAGDATPEGMARRLEADAGTRWRGREALAPTRRAYLDALLGRIREIGGTTPDLDGIAASHHYDTGVLLSLMALCREGDARLPDPGPGDPVLGATVSSYGRPRPFAEAMGPVFHWILERRAGRAVPEASFGLLADELARMAGDVAVAYPARVRRGDPWA